MELYSSSAVLAFPLDGLHSVPCSGVRKLRDEEAASEAEALERWLADGGKVNFEKTWHSNVGCSHKRWGIIQAASANPLWAGFFVIGQSGQAISPWSEGPFDFFCWHIQQPPLDMTLLPH